MLIRPMTESDVPAVVGGRARVLPVSLERGHLPGLPARGLHLSRGRYSAGAVIGYGVMSVGAGEAHILNVCVAASFRSRGVGTAPAGPTCSSARAAAGMGEAFLEVRRRTPSAIRLYQSPRIRAGRHAPRLLPGRRRARRCCVLQLRDLRERRRTPTVPEETLHYEPNPAAEIAAATHVCDHLAPRRRQDHADREAAAVRRRDPDGRHRQGPQGRAPCDLRLDARSSSSAESP